MPTTATRITIDTPVAFRDPLPEAVDVAIVGGGVIGVFAALYLARRGKRVLLCEKGRIAGEQSSRNLGWIRQQGRDEAELPIMMKSRQLWLEADRETGGACGVTACGVTYLASSDKERTAQEDWLSIAAQAGLDTRALTRTEISDLFNGAGRHDWVGGIVTPSDCRGEPWVAVPAAARLAQNAGALIRENCAVRALDMAAGQITGIVTEDGRVACEQVILAAGAWSALFARRHGITLPQLSVRGSVAQTAPMPDFFTGAAADEDLALRRRADGGFTLALGFDHTFYLGPDAFRHFRLYLPTLRNDWRHTAFRPNPPQAGYPDGWRTPRNWAEDRASPFEAIRVLEPQPDPAAISRMADLFSRRFPGIGRPEIRASWAGMIDTMPDVVPVIDRVPDCPGLILATGMSGHGFGIGPGFGHVLAGLACGDTPEFDLRRFRFSRFSDGSALEIGSSL